MGLRDGPDLGGGRKGIIHSYMFWTPDVASKTSGRKKNIWFVLNTTHLRGEQLADHGAHRRARVGRASRHGREAREATGLVRGGGVHGRGQRQRGRHRSPPPARASLVEGAAPQSPTDASLAPVLRDRHRAKPTRAADDRGRVRVAARGCAIPPAEHGRRARLLRGDLLAALRVRGDGGRGAGHRVFRVAAVHARRAARDERNSQTAFAVADSAVLSSLPPAVARFVVGSGVAWRRAAPPSRETCRFFW